MTIAKCTECNAPQPGLDFDIYSGFKTTPKICFEILDDGICKNCFRNNTYVIVLEDLLKHAILDSIQFDLGKGSHRITKLLRDYADKIDTEANKHKHKWDD